jgi:hypothetical protein
VGQRQLGFLKIPLTSTKGVGSQNVSEDPSDFDRACEGIHARLSITGAIIRVEPILRGPIAPLSFSVIQRTRTFSNAWQRATETTDASYLITSFHRLLAFSFEFEQRYFQSFCSCRAPLCLINAIFRCLSDHIRATDHRDDNELGSNEFFSDLPCSPICLSLYSANQNFGYSRSEVRFCLKSGERQPSLI